MPKKLDLICENPGERHVEFDVYFKSMDDEPTPCGVCGSPRLQYYGKRKTVPEVSGLAFHEVHEGVADRLEFHSSKEMDAHLDYVRKRQHNPDLNYVFPTAAERKRARDYHETSYWERQRSRGWGEREIQQQREARLEKMAGRGR